MKKFFAIALAVILLLSVVACSKKDETPDGEDNAVTTAVNDEVYTDETGADRFTYVVNEEGCLDIASFTSTNITPHKVVIPAKINNVEVTGIAAEAFVACNQISEIVIPETVKYIGDCAFANALYIQKVTMTSSVTELGLSVFNGCASLKEIALSTAITVIPESTFRACTALETITVPAAVVEIEGGAFYGCTALTTVVLPDGLKTIGDAAFYGCTALVSINEPAELENMGEHVFGSAQ